MIPMPIGDTGVIVMMDVSVLSLEQLLAALAVGVLVAVFLIYRWERNP
jgi:hypothetical protein